MQVTNWFLLSGCGWGLGMQLKVHCYLYHMAGGVGLGGRATPCDCPHEVNGQSLSE